MSKFFFLVTFYAIGLNCFSQVIRIEGTVLDNNQYGIISSTVIFYDADSTILSATTTNNNGHFTLNAIMKGNKGVLEISHLSYLTQLIDIKKDTSITVYLQDKPYNVDEVVVVGKKPAIVFKEGNMVANISSIPNASSSNVAKVITKLPGVTVSEKEGLTLNGVSATLYIDGRKQSLPGSSVIKMLQALPATSIDQVELIAMANGMYDASDNGAIINLKTKKQKVDGYYLTIGGESSMDAKDNKIDGGNNVFYMFKKKNILFNTSLSYLHNYWWSITKDSSRYTNGSDIVNISNYSSRNNVYTGSANLAWYIKDNHILNFNTFIYNAFTAGKMNQPTQVLNSPNDKEFILSKRNRDHDDLWAGNVEYSSPDSLASKVVMSYGIVYGGIRSKNDYYNQLLPLGEKEWYLYTNPQMVGHRHTGKIDFTQHYKYIGLKLQVGAKADIGKLNDDVKYVENNNLNNYPNSHFTGKENVYGGYFRIVYDINQKWGVNGSVRMEYTDYDISLASDNVEANDTYCNFFPYLHVYYKHSDNYQTVFAFTSRILRPNYEHMLPGIRYGDEFSYSVGNPYLKPAISRGLAWAHYLYGHGNVIISYTLTKDVEGQILTGKNNNIREYTYMNYADSRRLNVAVNLPFEFINKKLSGNVSGYVDYNTFINPKNGYIIPEDRNDFWRWNVKSSINYLITNGLILYTWVGYYPAYKNLQFDYESNWGMDLGVTYSMMRNEMLTIALEAENIFNTNKTKYIYYYDSNVLHSNKEWSNRVVKLTISLKLSSGQKIEDKAKGNINDISRFKTD